MAVISIGTGRPPKPAALKRAAGTDRKDRKRAAGPAPKALEALPPPPGDLSKQEAAAWRTLVGIVEPLKVATAADMVAFRQMAVTLAIIDQARDRIRKKGLTFEVITPSGRVTRRRPEVEILIAYKKQLSVELSRFGLTPADRERVTPGGDDAGDANPLSEFSDGA